MLVPATSSEPVVEPHRDVAVVGIEVDDAGRVVRSSRPRSADRIGSMGIDIEASGRHAPKIVSAPARPAHARATRAVLPTPASPATTSVCASSAAERSRSVLTVPSSRSRPTNTGANGSSGTATVPVWHCEALGNQGFRAGSQGRRPDSAGCVRVQRAAIGILRKAATPCPSHARSAHPCSSSPRERSLATAAAGSATARPESAPEPPAVQSARLGECPLARIGDQFIRCDDLTGAGVAAPAWTPEQ